MTKIAIVGTGFVADYYMTTLANHPQLELAGVWDRDAGRLETFAAFHGARRYDSLQDVLGDAETQIVVNLTPPASHFEVSKAALDAGKHVYCEKPLAMSFDEARTLTDLADKKSLTLCAAPANALSDAFDEFAARLASGAIGRPRLVYAEMDGVMTVAEESTAFPGVSAPVHSGGLGFGFKWNMGWMNDTLSYIREDPVHRKYHHGKIEFGLHYAFSENFVLPLSHDEVVHGKGSMLDRMPGQGADKFANLRAYYGFMWGHPGKKLLFMGSEFAQGREWNHDSSLDWHLLDTDLHKGVQNLVRDLNMLYASAPALYELDSRPEGFEWLLSNADESVFAWLRRGKAGARPMLVVSNFTPVERSAIRLGVPASGRWAERLNTNAAEYAGSGTGNLGGVASEDVAAAGQPHSIVVTLPPLTTLFFELEAAGV